MTTETKATPPTPGPRETPRPAGQRLYWIGLAAAGAIILYVGGLTLWAMIDTGTGLFEPEFGPLVIVKIWPTLASLLVLLGVELVGRTLSTGRRARWILGAWIGSILGYLVAQGSVGPAMDVIALALGAALPILIFSAILWGLRWTGRTRLFTATVGVVAIFVLSWVTILTLLVTLCAVAGECL